MIMKPKYLILLAAGVGTLVCGCKSDDYADGTTPLRNAVYLDAASVAPDTRVTFKKTVEALDRQLKAVFISPLAEATEVRLAVAEDAVGEYNFRHGTDYKLLGKEFYDLSSTAATVEAGKNQSEPVTIHFKGLDRLDIDLTALLPVTIAGTGNGVGVLEGSGTVYYLVRRSSAITTAANLTGCYMWIPSFETDEGRAAVNKLSALTYEAIININEFAEENEISSIMGAEQHCLLRLGDAGFPRQQLQVQIGGGKFPGGDKSKELQPGEWYHVAMTWDAATAQIRLYVNGRLQSEGTLAYDKPTIDLARAEASAYRFLIGYSYNTGRPLNGLISQVRVWSVVRTQEEIFRDMYDVESPETKPELRAYWKFDEGSGNTVKDWSQYGNDAVCLDGGNDMEAGQRNEGALKWDNSVEIPQLNQEQ